jgi:peptidoglycan/LPS O-acetylase OafA/YrhL
VNVLLLLCYYHKDAFTIDKFTHSFLTNTEPRIWSELAMVLNVHSLYFPGWTLQIEMIYSFVIIFLVFVTKTKKELLWLIVLASFFIGAPKIRMFMIHFVLGVSLAYYFPVINKMKYKESKLYAYRWPLYVLIFIFFSFRNLQHFFPFIKKTFEFLWPYHINAEHFSAVSSFLILVLVVMHKPAQVFLENKILLYLGKISYSIYLIHWLLVIFIMDYWDIWSKFLGDGYFRFYGMFVLYIATTIFLAGLLYRYVEQPFIKLSKRKLRKVSEKPV